MTVTICLLLVAAVDRGQENRATLQTRVIEQAIKKYYGEHGRWPIQTFDVAANLENGKNDLVDPWGKPYQYVLGEQQPGVTRPYVWAEREVDGKLRVYGSKPPEPKKK